MFQRVVSGPQSVLDALSGATVSGHHHAMIVSRRHHGVHLFERHAQCVMVVYVRSRRITGRVRLDPFNAVLDESPHRRPRFISSIDQDHQPFHADLAEVRIPVHQAADPADFPATCRQPGSRQQTFFNRLFQPDVDIEQTAATASGRITALQSELCIAGRQQRDVLDGVPGIEVFEGRDIEIRGMKMSLDESRHNRPAACVNHVGSSGYIRSTCRRACVSNCAIFDQQHTVSDRRSAGAVDDLPIADDCRTGCRLHGVVSLTIQDRSDSNRF